MDFKLNLSYIRIGGRISDEKDSQIKSNSNLYDVLNHVTKVCEDYSTIIHNARYYTHSKGQTNASSNTQASGLNITNSSCTSKIRYYI